MMAMVGNSASCRAHQARRILLYELGDVGCVLVNLADVGEAKDELVRVPRAGFHELGAPPVATFKRSKQRIHR